MGETDWGGNCALFWWVRPCSVNLESNFLLMGRAVLPPCCLTWDQTIVEVMKIKATSFKGPMYVCTVALSAPDPAAGYHWPVNLLETPGHSRASLGQSLLGSLLLSPGVHKVLFVPSKSLFPHSCVSSSGSMVGLMATSSKRAYAIPRRVPAPVAGCCWPTPLQETLKHSKACLAQSLWGLLVCIRFCSSPLNISGGCGVWF